MTKRGGMGDQLLIDGYLVSGDINSLSRIGGGLAGFQDVTGIDKYGFERIGLLNDGSMEFVSYFNDANTAPLGGFQVLKALPMTDRLLTYLRGTALGNDAASLVSVQMNYDGSRAADGSLTFTTSAQGNAYAIAWGNLLTAGMRTDTTATSPASGVDLATASTSFGWSAYLHVTAFTGTSVTVTLQDSADGTTFTSLTGGAFGAMAAIGGQRLAGSSVATVRRYVRAITTGTFTNAVFAVNFVRNVVAPR